MIESSIIFSMLLDGKGGGTEVSLADIEQWEPSKGTLWVHLDYENENMFEWLQRKFDLPKVVLNILLSSETRPQYFIHDADLIFHMRGINKNPDARSEDMVSLRVFVNESLILTLRHRKVIAIQDIYTELKMGQGPKSSYDLLIKTAKKLSTRIGETLNEISESIDLLEDTAFEENNDLSYKTTSQIRKKLLTIKRYLKPQAQLFSEILDEDIPGIETNYGIHLKSLYNSYNRHIDSLEYSHNRVLIARDEQESQNARKINSTMYILSTITAIFLPLSFLTGLLGINVAGIPGTEYPMAFAVVCGIVVAVSVLQIVFFKFKRWL